jgi:hypothetical protein
MSKLQFEIFQEGISFGDAIESQAKSAKGIMKQIKGRLLHLMLLKKETKGKGGINPSKPVYFIFKVGNTVINTHEIESKFNAQSKLKISLRVGYTGKSIRQFFKNVDILVNFMLRGDKAYSDKEVEALEQEYIDFMLKQREATKSKLSKKVAEEAEVSAN